FGTGKQAATHFDTDQGEEDLFIDAYAQDQRSMVVPVGEIEIGAGFKTEMGRANAFFQLGLNAQAWGNIGNSSRSTIRSDEFSNVFTGTHGSVDNSTLGLIGFTLRGGLTY